ncbi:transposase, IS605 OrfB family protein, partial [Natrialba chahannaoensis JCM 10990]
SKGKNTKDYWSDFALCEYQTRPDVDLSTVESVQQVRAVWTGDEWELHFVCRVEIEVADVPGDATVGIDLGICTFAALAYEDETAELYPLGCLKEDGYYFGKHIANCDDSSSERAERLHRKWSNRRIGDLSGIREDKDGEVKNWGKHGNLDLHGWAFDRFTNILTYKAEMQGVEVNSVSERDTSKTCSCCGRERDANRVERGLYVCDSCGLVANADVSCCGRERDANRVERGLYVCDSCGLVANADVNGAENIRKVPLSPSGGSPEDRSNGWLAQPSTVLFDKEIGAFAPRKQVRS